MSAELAGDQLLANRVADLAEPLAPRPHAGRERSALTRVDHLADATAAARMERERGGTSQAPLWPPREVVLPGVEL